VYVYFFVSLRETAYIYIYIYIYLYNNIRVYIYLCVSAVMYVTLRVYIHICIYIYMCIYIYIYIYTHTHAISMFFLSCFFSSLILFFSLYKYLYIKYLSNQRRERRREVTSAKANGSRYLPDTYEPSAKKSHLSNLPPVILIINNARPASFCVLYILASRFCTGFSLRRNVPI